MKIIYFKIKLRVYIVTVCGPYDSYNWTSPAINEFLGKGIGQQTVKKKNCVSCKNWNSIKINVTKIIPVVVL